MAVQKPRTTAKRPTTSSRSVRVAKKKQGVSKKQALLLIAVLAVIGVVAVVASRAATINKVYFKVQVPRYGIAGSGKTFDGKLNKVSSDGAASSSFETNDFNRGSLSRDKTQFAQFVSDQIRFYSVADGLLKGAIACPASSCYMDPIWFSGNKRIAVITEPGKPTTAVRAVNTDGSEPKVLVTRSKVGGGDIGCVNLNKAGDKMLFTVSSRYLYIMNNDGTALKRIADVGSNSMFDTCPTMSPDSRKIALVASSLSGGRAHNLLTIKPDGTGLSLVKALATESATSDTTVSGDNSLVSWSPGSSSLLYTLYSPSSKTATNLYSIDVNTKKVTAKTSNKDTSIAISKFGWSSDGRVIFGYGPRAACTAGVCTSGYITAVKSIKADNTSAKILYQKPANVDAKNEHVADLDF